MLTAAFRGFGGEEIVKDFLTSLPGGFWTQFIVVMAVIFVLSFFLDFIEIAIVVVPIVAPILLAETSANVTAVWLGCNDWCKYANFIFNSTIWIFTILSKRGRTKINKND